MNRYHRNRLDYGKGYGKGLPAGHGGSRLTYIGPTMEVSSDVVLVENPGQYVPKSMPENLCFRAHLLEQCAVDLEFRDAVMAMCSYDFNFWIDTLAWGFDPRKASDNKRKLDVQPFILWPYQVEAAAALEKALADEEDVLIEKSRDMGASWIMCLWFLWRWLFRPNQSLLLFSRTETLVDGDTDSLFAHLDFTIARLPPWMLPRNWVKTKHRLKLYLVNPENGSVIEGESTTDNIGRGGRRTAIGCDEFAAVKGGGYEVLAATIATTNTRIFNSTPKGPQNAFFSIREKGTPRIRMHWSSHPEKNQGLYRPLGKGTQVEIIDHEWHRKNPGYLFNGEVPQGEEGVRSPWYDKQCARASGPIEIAQELDIDYQGSSNPFFPPELLDALRQEHVKQPLMRGFLENKGSEQQPLWVFQQTEGGPLSIWIPLYNDALYDESPSWVVKSRHEFGVGSDISHGSGASNSVSSVGNLLDGTMVAQLVSNRWSIEEFAQQTVALARFFHCYGQPAQMIWEANGPGQTFGRHVVERLKFARVWYYRDENRLNKAISDKPGFYMNEQQKMVLLTDYKEALYSRRFINPCAESLREAGNYVHDGNSVTYKGLDERQKQGHAHGDRVIADALCCKLVFRGSIERRPEEHQEPRFGSLAYRRREREREAEFAADEW